METLVTKDKVASQFDKMSREYASSLSQSKGFDLEILVRLLEPQPGMDVLDIATGAGHTAAAIAPFVKSVTAIDLSTQMIERTRALCIENKLGNVNCAVMDAENLGFKTGMFDGVTCRIAPHHFLDVPKAMSEIARVLRKGGKFILIDSLSPYTKDLDDFINRLERLRDPTHVRSYSAIEWHKFLVSVGLVAKTTLIYRKIHRIEEWIRRAGSLYRRDEIMTFVKEASNSAKEYFEISYDKKGEPLTYTDDKIIIASLKENNE